MEKLPKWADLALVPLISLLLAAVISALVLLAIGQSPMEALKVMVDGAVGSPYAWGYTLYYATSFIFTGLAVTVAFHAGLFNIGGEGQAQLGGLGVALVCLALPWPHWSIALIAAMIGAAAFGAAWAAIPAYLQAKRGSHIVITTIMFNYIGAALIIYLLVNVLRPKGSMDPASASFPPATHLPKLSDMALGLGFEWGKNTPANITFFIAIGALPSSVCAPTMIVSSETFTVEGGSSRTVISPLGTCTLPAIFISSPAMESFRSGATSSLA